MLIKYLRNDWNIKQGNFSRSLKRNITVTLPGSKAQETGILEGSW